MNDQITTSGERCYVQATVTISDGIESTSTTAFARESLAKKGMDEAQITGAASSYARKYALAGLFAIDDSRDDPDTKPPTTTVHEAITATMCNTLSKLLDETHTDTVNFLDYFQRDRLDDLTMAEAKKGQAMLKAKKSKVKA
jgi:hypothetical protein